MILNKIQNTYIFHYKELLIDLFLYVCCNNIAFDNGPKKALKTRAI